jgi:prepilin-type N-terminal cleavage/methylation domain-containing protein
MTSHHQSAGSGRASRAFTLIELIVVITIIAILMSIALLGAHHIRQNSQNNVTRDLIKTLDTAYSGMVQEKGANVPAVYRDDQNNELAVIDATVKDTSAIEPSLGLFILASGSDSAITTAILRADSKYVANSQINSNQHPSWTSAAKVPLLKDAWGNPIRFVHPRYAGGYGNYFDNASTPAVQNRDPKTVTLERANNPQPIQFVRSYRPENQMVSADEGLCNGNVGYFYSDGADANAGTRDDNVYSSVPKFPAETAKYSSPPAGT